MLRNLRCWLFEAPPSFPLWLLSGDRVTINGSQFINHGWPKLIRDEKALCAHFAVEHSVK